MKSYLDLVSEYSKVHKNKNRLTIICIAISVMLVTAIFGMADLSLNAQTDEAIRRYGNWHMIVSDISDETAADIAARADVAVSGFLGMASDTTYGGKELVVQSSSEELAYQMNLTVTEGHYPVTDTEALIDKAALIQLGLAIGDNVEVAFQGGQTKSYVITGVYGNFSSLQGTDAHGLQLIEGGLRFLPEDLYAEYNYIQFEDRKNINHAVRALKAAYGLSDDQVSTNIMLLGLMGQSDDTTMLEVYLTAGILFLLVALAGTFMIASSFNMSIMERTQFFGLLRCLGATKKQIKRYIRREGLLYCIKAIPLGLAAGSGVLWISIHILNTLNSKHLPQMPEFQLSLTGILAGTLIGILVVMIASNSPAKKASKVSPQAAVTGNLDKAVHQYFGKSSGTRLFHVDTAMGLRHAFSNKKSMVLIAGSFAISIILFLCFTIFVTFMNHALSPLKPYAPDLTVEGTHDNVSLPVALKETISMIDGVEKVYGSMFCTNIPAADKETANLATLVSYDEPQFEWAGDVLIDGNIEDVQRGKGVLVDYGYAQEFGWQSGDEVTLTLGGKAHQVTVSGIVSDVPIDASGGAWIFVCSENLFTDMTGVSQYKVIEVQSDKDVSAQIRSLLPPDMKLLDFRQQNEEIRTGYFAMAVFVYGFLIVIALVAVINIVNTVNASVSGRINHYGVMRAIGMSGKQLKKVVRAEAAAYAIMGSLTGGILGLILHRIFFTMLITSNWGQVWKPPIFVLCISVSAAILTTCVAVISPTKKIEKTSIINVVNAG